MVDKYDVFDRIEKSETLIDCLLNDELMANVRQCLDQITFIDVKWHLRPTKKAIVLGVAVAQTMVSMRESEKIKSFWMGWNLHFVSFVILCLIYARDVKIIQMMFQGKSDGGVFQFRNKLSFDQVAAVFLTIEAEAHGLDPQGIAFLKAHCCSESVDSETKAADGELIDVLKRIFDDSPLVKSAMKIK